MKKFLVIVVAMVLCSSAAFAQQKGDKYIGGAVGVNLQSIKIESDSATDFSFGVNLEYAEFLANRFKVGVGFGYARTSGVHVLDVSANVAYYVPLCEKLYYTPSVGISALCGIADSVPETGYGVGFSASLFSLEFMPKEHFSISLNLVSLDYIWFRYYDYSFDALNFNFGLNPTVGFKYYF
jgi:hypothetical protein